MAKRPWTLEHLRWRPAMSRRPLLALAALGAVLAAGCAEPQIPTVEALPTPIPTATPTETPGPTAGPTATPSASSFEPGLSDELIRVGVVADLDTGDVTGALGQSAVEAVTAWAAAVNSIGGLAGRQVEVVALDAALFNHADAMEQACAGDIFALVGSTALFDGDGLETLNAQGCRLPDFPGEVHSQERLASPLTFVSNPSTARRYNRGWATYWSEREPEATTAAATLLPELAPFVVAGERMVEAASASGFTFVAQPQVPFDTDFEAEVAALAEAEVGAVTWAADGQRFIGLLQALRAAEVVPAVLDCGQACYSAAWLEAAGEVANGVSVWLPTLPLEELNESSELTRYVFWLQSTVPGAVPTAAGVNAWAGALLFEEAVRRAVGEGTSRFEPGSLTRAAVVEAAGTVAEWDANGIHGPTNPAEREPSPCFVILQVRRGSFQRVHPQRRGTLDCEPANLYTLEQTVELEAAVEEDAAPTDAATPLPDDG